MSRALAISLFALGAVATPVAAQPSSTPPAVDVQKLYAEAPVIELVTMGIGSLIWERHGHIALCITERGLDYAAHTRADPRKNVCYNYGIGNFHAPIGMAWGFFRGTNSFWVGRQSPRELFAIYTYADRTVWVQPLPLTPEQKQKVIDKLEYDVLDANRYYSYDHFWDNCTTRVRDVLDGATGGALRAMKEPVPDRTFRDLARDGFFGMRVPLVITDIAMGRVTDRVPTYHERMFLPDYLREAAHELWGVKPIVIYERKGPPPLTDGPSGRVIFLLVVLLLTAPAVLARWLGRFQRTGLVMALVPPVLLGSILWFLAIISPLPYVMWNESCLILLPTDLALLFLSEPKRTYYARFRVAMLVLLLLAMPIGLVKAPLWFLIPWTLIPNAVVGFWPPQWTRALRRAEPAKPAEPATTTATSKKPAGKRRKR
jgi:hypothetical protein